LHCNDLTVAVFEDQDLQAGAHLNAVGSYHPDVTELPSATVCRARVGWTIAPQLWKKPVLLCRYGRPDPGSLSAPSWAMFCRAGTGTEQRGRGHFCSSLWAWPSRTCAPPARVLEAATSSNWAASLSMLG